MVVENKVSPNFHDPKAINREAKGNRIACTCQWKSFDWKNVVRSTAADSRLHLDGRPMRVNFLGKHPVNVRDVSRNEADTFGPLPPVTAARRLEQPT